MTLNKYSEAISKIECTEEIGERVLRNIDHHFRTRKMMRRSVYSTVGILAAAALLFLIVRFLNSRAVEKPGGNEPPIIASSFKTEKFDSAEKLSEAAGYEVREISGVPFEITERVYELNEKSAVITYIGKEDKLYFEKSSSEETLTEYEVSYPDSKTVARNNTEVTLKGENSIIYQALWTDGEYYFSIRDENGIGEEEILRMIDELLSGT